MHEMCDKAIITNPFSSHAGANLYEDSCDGQGAPSSGQKWACNHASQQRAASMQSPRIGEELLEEAIDESDDVLESVACAKGVALGGEKLLDAGAGRGLDGRDVQIVNASERRNRATVAKEGKGNTDIQMSHALDEVIDFMEGRQPVPAASAQTSLSKQSEITLDTGAAASEMKEEHVEEHEIVREAEKETHKNASAQHAMSTMNGHKQPEARSVTDSVTGSQRRAETVHQAAQEGDTQKLRELLDGGGNAVALDALGFTPLHFAACYGHPDSCALLLERGASPEAQSTHGWTPLHVAARNGRTDVLQLLLAQGADVNTSDVAKWTALHNVGCNGNVDCIKALVRGNADVNMQDKGQAPLYSLCACVLSL